MYKNDPVNVAAGLMGDAPPPQAPLEAVTSPGQPGAAPSLPEPFQPVTDGLGAALEAVGAPDQGGASLPDGRRTPTKEWLPHARTTLDRRIDKARSAADYAFEHGLITEEQAAWVHGVDDKRTALERFLGYNEHSSPLNNAFGVLETITGQRFVLAVMAARAKGMKDYKGDSILGMQMGWSTEEFIRQFRSRRHTAEILIENGWEDRFGTSLAGFMADVLTDPSTFLSIVAKTSANVVVKAGSKLAEAVGYAGRTQLTEFGADVMRFAAPDFQKHVMEKAYKQFGVTAETITPQHIMDFMAQRDVQADLAEFAAENFDLYATQLVDFTKGLGEKTVFRSRALTRGLKLGGMTPKGLAYHQALKAGPKSMFQATAGIGSKQFGVVTDKALQSVMGSAARAAEHLTDAAFERVTNDTMAKFVTVPTRTATKLASWLEHTFTPAIERVGLEDRIIIQHTIDKLAHEDLAFSRTLREKATRQYVRSDGTLRAPSEDELKMISHHLENPSLHECPDGLEELRDFARETLDDIFEEEFRHGLVSDKLEDYVAHFYDNNKIAARIHSRFQEYAALESKEVVSEAVPVEAMTDFMFHRQIASLDEAVQVFGQDAVEANILAILHRRARVSRQLIAKRQLMDQMIKSKGIGGVKDAWIVANQNWRRLVPSLRTAASMLDGGPRRLATDGERKALMDVVRGLEDVINKIAKKEGKFSPKILDEMSTEAFGKPLSELTTGEVDILREFFEAQLSMRTAAGAKSLKAYATIDMGKRHPRILRDWEYVMYDGVRFGHSRKYFEGGEDIEPFIPSHNVEYDEGAVQRLAKHLWKQAGKPGGTRELPEKFIEQARVRLAGKKRKISHIAMTDYNAGRKAARAAAEEKKRLEHVLPKLIEDTEKRMGHSREAHATAKRWQRLSKQDKALVLTRIRSETGEGISAEERKLYWEALIEHAEKAGVTDEAQIKAEFESLIKDVQDLVVEEVLDWEKKSASQSYKEFIHALKRKDKDAMRFLADPMFRKEVIGAMPKFEEAEKTIGKMKDKLKRLNEELKSIEKPTKLKPASYLVPKDIAQAIRDIAGSPWDPDNGAHKFMRFFQRIQQWYKPALLLPFPEYYGRNFMTGATITATKLGVRMLHPDNFRTFGMVVAHMLNLDSIARLADSTAEAGLKKGMLKKLRTIARKGGQHKIITDTGVEYTIEQIANEAVARGVTHGFTYAELRQAPFAELPEYGFMRAAPQWARSFASSLLDGAEKAKNAMFAMARGTDAMTDITFRVALFVDEVKHGQSFDKAAEAVRKYLNDYSRLSADEQVYMKTAMPFYSWLNFSVEQGMKMFIEHPFAVQVPHKIAANMNLREPDPKYQPKWINERIGIWYKDPNGYYKRLQGFGLLQEEATRTVADAYALGQHMFDVATAAIRPPNPRQFESLQHYQEFLGNVDFIAKAAWELSRGRTTFGNSAFAGDAKIAADALGEAVKMERGWYYNEVEGEKLSTGGRFLRWYLEYQPDAENPMAAKINPVRRHLLSILPTSRFVSTYERHRANVIRGDKTWADVALGVLGVKVYVYDPETNKYYYDRELLDAAQRLLETAHAVDINGYFKSPADVRKKRP